MKLEKTMLEYIKELGETSTFDRDEQDWYYSESSKLNKIRSLANFLSQPLNISMFVPAKLMDGVWVVLDFPILKGIQRKEYFNAKYQNYRQEYQQAKENVIFEGFELIASDEEFTTILNKTNKIKLHFDLKHKEIVFEISTQNGHLTTIESLIQFKLELNTNNKKIQELWKI